MTNTFKKSLLIAVLCLVASISWAAEVTFTMSSIFDGQKLSFDVTSPVSAKVTTNTSKGNAPSGKLGSTNNYFEIILNNDTYNAAKINGFINTNNTSGYDWGFQFSTDKGATWSQTVSQPNDGNKTVHEITVNATIPANANGFRVIRLAGTSTTVASIVLNLDGGSVTPTVNSVTVSPASVTLDPNGTQQLTATVDATPASADKTVTWTTSNANVATVSESGLVTAVAQGTATITATSNLDNTKSGTCSVTVNAPAAPIPVTAISLDATAMVGIGSTITLAVTYTPADANQGKAVTWNTADAGIATVNNGVVTGVAKGTVAITATSTTDPSITATCNVTVQEIAVTGVSLNKSSLNLQIGGNETLTATVAPNNATNKNVTWNSSNTNVATVNNGKVTGVTAGTATITVTTVDGNKEATCSVTVTAGPPVPQTDLSIHVPEIYEAKEIAGGYNTPLAVVGGREYEVFYINRDNSSNLTIATSNADKAGNICDGTSTSNTAKAKDGWLTISCNGTGGDTNAGAADEFQASIRSAKLTNTSHSLEMHIQGYDQFSFYGNDNNQDASKNKLFEVYIDNIKQTRTPHKYAIERFDISTGEHVIRITGSAGAGDNKLCSFSLRVSQEPRTKWLKGNDSTQIVMQTTALKPVTYVTKYNNIPGAETILEWIGAEATDIGLTKIEGPLTDTLVLSGTANCSTGVYKYAVIAKYNGVETSRAEGSFKVASDIKATSDIEVDVYNNEEMDQITFKYYAINAEAVQLTWPNGQPTGISGSGNNGKYIIGGTPTLTGPFPKTFPYTITVTGADTVISGKITVKELNYGANAVLYLYKNNRAYESDAVYKHISNTTIDGTKWNLIARKQKEDGLRPQEQYANYKWILISEDVEANNTEVIQIIRGGANLPVLNLKGFTYATDGLDDITRLGWGEPDNGAIDSAQTKVNGCKIKIEQPTHPVFSKMTGVTKNAEIAILDGYEQHGIMPIRITKQGTLCLATGYTRSQEDYWGVGELQTAIHEVPADMRGGKKYICLPIARTSVLSAQGNKLVDGIVTYLTSAASSSVEIPKCQITKFTVAGIDGEIDHAAHSIIVNMTVEEFQEADSLKDAEPTIVLADPQNTIVIPDSKELRYAAMGLPKKYTVTDYINQWVYEVSVRLYTPQGIEQTYESGMWVNIFDIYGRKVATTNEDIYTMDLPHGMYIVVTETGSTVKIMR